VPVSSTVIGPPEACCFDLSLRVRSPLIASQWVPPSVVLKMRSASVINRVRIVRRGHDGRRPLKTVIERGRTARIGEFGPHSNTLDLVRAPVEASDVALIVAGIHNVRVERRGRNISRFPRRRPGTNSSRPIAPSSLRLAIATVELSCCAP